MVVCLGLRRVWSSLVLTLLLTATTTTTAKEGLRSSENNARETSTTTADPKAKEEEIRFVVEQFYRLMNDTQPYRFRDDSVTEEEEVEVMAGGGQGGGGGFSGASCGLISTFESRPRQRAMHWGSERFHETIDFFESRCNYSFTYFEQYLLTLLYPT